MNKIKIYNSLTKKKEILKPINDNEVGIYTCGPTVYWYQHIVNLRTYVFEDILKRVLKYFGYNVKHIMNVTDVGHLTSDADTGEDKMEKAAAKEGKKAEDIANYYWEIFRNDFKKLNIEEPNIWCKATDHIKEQINLIKKLEEKGFTYETSDGIYFDSSKFKDYGKLARLDKEGLQAGKRVDIGEKKNKTDFALWKFSKPEDKRQQEWESPWGTGFPGWHIECSAMSMKYLGENFDIHCGGIDHLHVHHPNEIAQAEAATGKKFVNIWMHGEFLTFKGEKVSKSKGGLFTVSELEEKEFLPLSYRYLCLTTHYRKPLDFSLEGLENAQNSYNRLRNIVLSLEDDKKENKKYLEEFEKIIENDLDMPRALAVLWNLLRDEGAEGKVNSVKKIDEILGLDLFKKDAIPQEMKELAERREIYRKEKNWKESDKIRDEIEEKGYEIRDSDKGYEIRKK